MGYSYEVQRLEELTSQIRGILLKNSPIVIGAGYIGRRLSKKLGCKATTRAEFNLLDFDPSFLKDYSTIYLCAGANGAKRCEGQQDAYRANVDATQKIARHSLFLVWISSMSIEWSEGAYQRQKRQAEALVSNMDNVATIRAGRVVDSNIDDLCDLMVEVGTKRVSGLYRWGNDDIAYQK